MTNAIVGAGRSHPGHVGATAVSPSYDVSADGQRFLTIAPGGEVEEQAPAKIRVVENWYEEFRNREQN